MEITADMADELVSAWRAKRERGNEYGMGGAGEWFEQMDAYCKSFLGMEFILFSASEISSSVKLSMRFPFGKKWRKRPLCRSFSMGDRSILYGFYHKIVQRNRQFVRLPSKAEGQASLSVCIDKQHLPARLRQPYAQVGASRRFGCAALLVGKADNVRIHFLHFLSFFRTSKKPPAQRITPSPYRKTGHSGNISIQTAYFVLFFVLHWLYYVCILFLFRPIRSFSDQFDLYVVGHLAFNSTFSVLSVVVKPSSG